MSIENTIVVICILLGILYSIFLYDELNRSFEEYKAESYCVMQYIPKGIPRKDILTGHGTCWINSK